MSLEQLILGGLLGGVVACGVILREFVDEFKKTNVLLERTNVLLARTNGIVESKLEVHNERIYDCLLEFKHIHSKLNTHNELMKLLLAEMYKLRRGEKI